MLSLGYSDLYTTQPPNTLEKILNQLRGTELAVCVLDAAGGSLLLSTYSNQWSDLTPAIVYGFEHGNVSWLECHN